MIRRNYTEEVGLSSGTPRVPMPLAIVLLAGFVAAFWFGITKLDAISDSSPTSTTPVAQGTAGARTGAD